jgi:hypothetical protein
MPELRSGARPPPVVARTSEERKQKKRQSSRGTRCKEGRQREHAIRTTAAARLPNACAESKLKSNASDLKHEVHAGAVVDAEKPTSCAYLDHEQKTSDPSGTVAGAKQATESKLKTEKEAKSSPLDVVTRELTKSTPSYLGEQVIGHHTAVDDKKPTSCTASRQGKQQQTTLPLARLTRGSDRNKLGTVADLDFVKGICNNQPVKEAGADLEENREVMDEVSGGRGAEKAPGLDEEQTIAPLPERVS